MAYNRPPIRQHAPCPPWVTSGHLRCKKSCPLYPRQRPRKRISAQGHVGFTPESGHVRCGWDSTRTFHQSIVLVERSNVGVLDDF